ncbi:MAG: cytochrome P460 family protein [Chloroflexota bacterium]
MKKPGNRAWLSVALGFALAGCATMVAAQQQRGPAPTDDRVGFPEGYETTYKLLFVLDRPDNRQVRMVYGNDQAASGKPGEPFPYGSVLVMETWSARKDASGLPELGADGRYQKDQLTGIFVQRKEPAFGEAYQLQRSGEWEYVAYKPDRSHLQPPENTNACAACHQDAGRTRDWVFRADLFFQPGRGAVPTPVEGLAALGRLPIQNYSFVPASATFKVGSAITWVNEDEAIHTVTAVDNSFDSGRISLGGTFRRTFETPGTFDYVCTVHQNMRARIVVE